jgi:phosphatidylserine decarboxylase
MKAIENLFWHPLSVSKHSDHARLQQASQLVWKVTKSGGKLRSVCDMGKWKHRFQRVTGIDLAARALRRLSKIGLRRHGSDRHRVERRSFRHSSGSIRHRDHKHTLFADGQAVRQSSKTISTESSSPMSWGELVHRNDERYSMVLKQYNYRLALYRKMPLKAMSRLWGQFNQLELPLWLRRPSLRLYIWMFGCSLQDAAVQDLSQYRNLSEFFRRVLRPGIRPIDGAHILTSPADGKVLHCGAVKDGMLEQVKGVNYSLFGFLGPLDHLLPKRPVEMDAAGLTDEEYYQKLLINPANKLYHCIIYLAPGDYHRFHSPADWTVYARRHFPGELFSVNPGIARWLQGVFNFNERAVYVGKWNHGFFSMTAVGATNVGSINVKFDKTLSTNTGTMWPSGSYYDHHFNSVKKQNGHIQLQKGELFGDFNLGSTIVLLFEAPQSFCFRITPGQRLRYGQGIGGCARQLSNHYSRK